MKKRPKNDQCDIKPIFDDIRDQIGRSVDEMEEFFREHTSGKNGIEIAMCMDGGEKEAKIGFMLCHQYISVSMDEFLDKTEEVWNDTDIDWEGLIESLSLLRDKIRSRIAKAKIEAKKQGA